MKFTISLFVALMMAISVQSSLPYTCLAEKDKPEGSCVASNEDDQGTLTYFVTLATPVDSKFSCEKVKVGEKPTTDTACCATGTTPSGGAPDPKGMSKDDYNKKCGKADPKSSAGGGDPK
ncbi:hypothetical protein PtA15_13A298 [Puccinia triticina]|uniref:Secreted protein n=1 Tax=Puccinia triticina TaxID=208348 RepID=A0ABY7D0X8_9BASI|nr:uncharacterized protein PtA15_13A295 [Puccinia triticina]XP_053026453.1 uncharacterized protein PtA15_13A298 [Puccinia triticina]WAQ90895.1 hypothetical protein PtA15_13A295 [Puccinia triticina]WAQ90898.1 hypothetical protein PtA15_13A298 [Puccinia triticina]